MKHFPHLIPLLLFIFLLPACAMQRSTDAEKARTFIRGMTKAQVFACMGIPTRKGHQEDLEIWLYRSGNEYKEKNRVENSTQNSESASFFNMVDASLSTRHETSEKRYCIIQILMKDDIVQSVNYSGPTGGWLTEDEQCAFATRNCLP